MGKGRQRGTGVRIRSEAKAAAADRLLLAAQEQAELHDNVQAQLALIPWWRPRLRRRAKRLRVLALERYMQSIRAAQDVAKKGRYVDV